MKKHFSTKAVQLALRTMSKDNEVPNKILDLSQFIGKQEIVYRRPATTNGYSFFMLDVTLCEDDVWRLIEANGSNAALSSIAVNGDEARVKHLLELFISKESLPSKCVVIFVHQFRFIHLAEFFCRAARFAELLSHYKDVELRNADEEIGNEQVTVIAGEISEVANHIEFNNDELFYKGVPIMLASNPNLLPELERNGVVNKQRQNSKIDTEIFHEQKCTNLIHDKSMQQDLCKETGIEPLQYQYASTMSKCLAIVNEVPQKGKVLVGKMNAGSGGTGIEFFTPWQTEKEFEKKLNEMESTVCSKYGNNALSTMYPVRFFEFAKSKEIIIEGKGHLWDLRLEVLVYNGFVEVRPTVVRVCPEPFDGSYTRNSVVSNLSGRIDAKMLSKFMYKSPFDPDSSFHSGLNISQQKLDELIGSTVKWSENAMAM